MTALIGKKMDKQMLYESTKKQKETVRAAVREIDREIMRIQMESNYLYYKIQEALKKNYQEVLRVLAKYKMRNQAAIARFEVYKANLACLYIKMMELVAMQIMTGAITANDYAMQQMMSYNDIKQISKDLYSFERNMNKMNDRQEYMDEMLDEVFYTANEDSSIEQLVDYEVARLVAEFYLKSFAYAGVYNLNAPNLYANGNM